MDVGNTELARDSRRFGSRIRGCVVHPISDNVWMNSRLVHFACCASLLVTLLAGALRAEDPTLRERVTRGLALVERAARNYPTHRQCFSCHHQTLPLLAMRGAREVGLTIDEPLLPAQLAFAQATFEKRKGALLRGERTDGAAITVAYGLWTFQIADAKPSELADAMVVNLLALQGAEGHWRPQSIRPPLAESLVSCTVLSAYGLKQFARDEQQTAAEAAISKGKAWLASAKLVGTEDFAFRLWGLQVLDGTREEVDRARQALLALQRADGGWAQLPDMESDAYATGQALYLLRECGLPITARAYERGAGFLRRTQETDGSWHVKTRARPVQIFFDNGDPHGKDQFISIAATSWAIAALAPTIESTK